MMTTRQQGGDSPVERARRATEDKGFEARTGPTTKRNLLTGSRNFQESYNHMPSRSPTDF